MSEGVGTEKMKRNMKAYQVEKRSPNAILSNISLWCTNGQYL